MRTSEILDYPFYLLTRIMAPEDKLFLEVLMPIEFESDYEMIQSLVFTPTFDLSQEEKEDLERLKQKYQPGKYDVSFLYKHCRKKTREQYKQLHRNICHLLYD